MKQKYIYIIFIYNKIKSNKNRMPNLQKKNKNTDAENKIKTVFLNVSLLLPSVMITIIVMMIIIPIIIKTDNKTVTSTN